MKTTSDYQQIENCMYQNILKNEAMDFAVIPIYQADDFSLLHEKKLNRLNIIKKIKQIKH